MGGIGGSRGGAGQYIPMTVTNYVRMRGVDTGWGSADITIDNRGVIDVTWVGATTNHLGGGNYYFNIKNWAMIVNETQTAFNTAGGYPTDGNNSHLVIGTAGRIRFADSSAKIILDFGDNFEMGKAYSLDKLVIENNTGGTNSLKVDFDRLTTRSELYKLTKSGNNFIVNLATAKEAGYSTIGTLYKSNIRTMNNFTTISESLIYPHKYKGTNRGTRKRVIHRVKKTASLFDSFESNESFEYSPSIANVDFYQSFPPPPLRRGIKGVGLTLKIIVAHNFQITNLPTPSPPPQGRGKFGIHSLQEIENLSFCLNKMKLLPIKAIHYY